MNAPFQHDSTMVRKVKPHDAAELARIDAFVIARDDGTPFHRPAWMEAIGKACRHDWRYFTIEDETGEIAAILPVHMLHSALFGRALVSSGFAVGGGILGGDQRACARLAEAVWQFAETRSFPSVELRGGQLPDGKWQAKRDAYAGFVTDLAEDDEQQLLAIPRKQRAEVRKGLKNNLDVRVGRDGQDLADHYAVYAESVRNLGTPVFPRALFAEVIRAFGDQTDILTVSAEGRPVASVLSLYHGDTVMPYWGGGTWDARRLRANDIMYYALMNHARGKGCKHFDFGRSKVGTGAYSFKKNWGFEPVPLSYAVRTMDGDEARDVNPLSPKYRLQVALWQRLPLSIANRLGPMISRGLG